MGRLWKNRPNSWFRRCKLDPHSQFPPNHSYKLTHLFVAVFPPCPLISHHYPKLIQFAHFSALLSFPFTADWTSFPGASHLALVFANFISSSLQDLSPSPLLWPVLIAALPSDHLLYFSWVNPLPVHLFHKMLLDGSWFPRRLKQVYYITGFFFPCDINENFASSKLPLQNCEVQFYNVIAAQWESCSDLICLCIFKRGKQMCFL